jgi:hypothetical protein
MFLRKTYALLLLLSYLLIACSDGASDEAKPTTLSVIKGVNYALPQPVLLHDNLPSERGNYRLDSLKWQLLSMQGLVPYSANSGFFILGTITNTPGKFTSLVLYEENPSYNRAWIANYNATGAILDYRLVFQQRADGKVSQSGYLKDNVLEIKKTTTNTTNYQLLPSGQFSPL